MQENAELSSDRVIVENCFGRCTLLWKVTSLKYRWSEHMYNSMFQMCMGLTNIHICMHPLRDAYGEHYQQLRNKCFTFGEEGIKKENRLRHATATSANSDYRDNFVVLVILRTQRQVTMLTH